MSITAPNNILIKQLKYVNDNSKFYQNLFKENNIDIADIKTLDDLSLLPTTTKFDLQRSNSDFFCVSSDKISDIVTTSGTLGIPVTVPLTKNDLERLAINEANSFRTAGVTSSDIVQLMVTMEMRFMAGLAYFLGIQKLGATSLRIGPGSPVVQLENIEKFKPTVLIGVPSFVAKIVEYAENNGIDINSTSVKKIICIGDSIRDEDLELNSIGKRIIDVWNVDLHSTYASTEMATAFTECNAGKGGHLQDDLLIVEILDSYGNNLKIGSVGEVTITTIGIEGMPLVRFRTGDMAYLIDDKCSCGNNSMRLSSIIGRKEQMIKYKGTSLYPPAIIDVLNDFPKIANFYIEVYSDSLGSDVVKVTIGKDDNNQDSIEKLKECFRMKIRVVPQIFVDLNINIISKLNKNKSRKKQVFFDLRK
ncbi:MAG: AMP-binding protein [Bacteroidetes bacterium]|nr:AMP-binding protein [Bacteroidota bacterium]